MKLLLLTLNADEETSVDKIIPALADCVQLEAVQIIPTSIMSFPGL